MVSKVSDAAASGRRTGPKGHRTRALIKETIRRLLEVQPISEIKLSDICEAASVTIGAFYFHFDSKDAAVTEVAVDAYTAYYTRIANFPVTDNFLLDCYEISARYIWRPDHPRVVQGVYSALRALPDVYMQWRPLRSVVKQRVLDRVVVERTKSSFALDGTEATVELMMVALEGVFEMLFYRDFPEVAALSQDGKAFTTDIAVTLYRGFLGESPAAGLYRDIDTSTTPVGRNGKR